MPSLTVEIDPASATPVFEQIRLRLATMIAAEELPPGAKLPTIRQLAADLGLAVNTVARAYRELETAGLVLTRPRHGTTVADRAPSGPEQVRRRLRESARAYASAVRELGVTAEEAVAVLREELSA